jgi:hypothetical protein
MTEYIMTNQDLIEDHDHIWNQEHDIGNYKLAPGNLSTAHICSICGARKMVECFYDGRRTSGHEDILEEFELNISELPKLEK